MIYRKGEFLPRSHAPTPIEGPHFVCIGGSPSSGTTLLADLLDSTPGIGCPPELNIYCIPGAYRYDDRFRKAAGSRERFAVPAIYSAPMKFFNEKYLDAVGLTEADLVSLIETSSNLNEFAFGLAGYYARFRERNLNVFAEKTPININCSASFLSAFPDGVFLHVVRDGRAVAASLIHRGYSLYEAAMIWLLQVSAGRAVSRLPRVIDVRYEDIVAQPFVLGGLMALDIAVIPEPAMHRLLLFAAPFGLRIARRKRPA